MSEAGRWGLTRAGVGFCALGVGVGIAAVLTRDPLLGSILWGQLATLAAAATLSRRNLAGLRASRLLPEELFAETPARGHLRLTNPHPRPALQVTVTEAGAATGARIERITGHGHEVRAVSWRFGARGAAALVGLILRSDYPFGLIYRQRTLPLPAELVVYPRPVGRTGARILTGRGEQDDNTRRGTGEGDFQGMREYAPGDPVRRLHWPTTARVGRPMVVVTGERTATEVLIEVAEGRGRQWEAALSAAAAGIEQHFAAQNAVGLQLSGERLPPRIGRDWRRVLLQRLALAERREA